MVPVPILVPQRKKTKQKTNPRSSSDPVREINK
jgi:ribosomal protein L32